MDDVLAKKLTEKSEARVKKDPKFLEIVKANEDAEKNKGVIKLAEVRKKSKEEKNGKNGKKPGMKGNGKDKDEAGPLVQEAVNILADMATTP